MLQKKMSRNINRSPLLHLFAYVFVFYTLVASAVLLVNVSAALTTDSLATGEATATRLTIE